MTETIPILAPYESVGATVAGTSQPTRLQLVFHLVGQNFRSRYRDATLGFVWSIVQPLVQLLVFVFVFDQIARFEIDNFPAYVLIGVLTWNWFARGLMATTNSPLVRSDLLDQPGFPRWVIPVVTVTVELIDVLVAAPVLVLFLAFGPGLPATAPLALVLLSVQFCIILGLGMVLATLNVHVRDVSLAVSSLLFPWFYITPIFYTRDLVPEHFRWIIDANPMARLVISQRDLLLFGQLPDLSDLLVLYALAGVAITIGWVVYRRFSPDFVDHV